MEDEFWQERIYFENWLKHQFGSYPHLNRD